MFYVLIPVTDKMAKNREKNLEINDYENNVAYNILVSDEDYERALIGIYKFQLSYTDSDFIECF